MDAVLLILISYILGSIPVGLVLGLLSGVDVRQEGSGNIGATNVARVAGKTQGLLALLGDAAKGFIPVYFSIQFGYTPGETGLVALAAFLGHLYPVFLRFRGGKGVATALGVFLAIAPMATAVLGLIFLVVALLTRIVSLASMAAAGTAPIVLWAFSYQPTIVGISALMGLWIIWRHRENIQRLASNVEPRFRF
ncbi:MAG: glycerol-3-phosphate 1-O-acyltransferase PlsY [Deltaproteobacteria bacterium]|nr:glycerol-3-phosphate 1-O-acyltransferase PlsY [Deltaproteobacteria bacterium]